MKAAQKRTMRTPAAWLGKRINLAKWIVPAGYVICSTTGKLQTAAPAESPAQACPVPDVEIYSSAPTGSIFAPGYRPNKTPTLAHRRKYGFDPAIVVFLIEQESPLKAAGTQRASGVVFEIGLYSYQDAGRWYARTPALADWLSRNPHGTAGSVPYTVCTPVDPLRQTVNAGSVHTCAPFTPEYAVARCLLLAFFAANPAYRALLDTQAACQLPISQSQIAAAPTFKSQRAPSARRSRSNRPYIAPSALQEN